MLGIMAIMVDILIVMNSCRIARLSLSCVMARSDLEFMQINSFLSSLRYSCITGRTMLIRISSLFPITLIMILLSNQFLLFISNNDYFYIYLSHYTEFIFLLHPYTLHKYYYLLSFYVYLHFILLYLLLLLLLLILLQLLLLY